MGFMKMAVAASVVMFAAGSAQACQLICQKTVAAYDGNLGGLTGADAKCASEFGTGWKFPRSPSLVLNTATSVPGGNTSFNYSNMNKFTYGYSGYDSGSGKTYWAWVGSVLVSIGDIRNCSNWGSNSSGVSGGGLNTDYGGTVSYSTCNMQLPIICCNM